MRPGALRGHVSVAQVGTVTGAGAARRDAAHRADRDGLASDDDGGRCECARQDRRRQTTASYVGVKIRTFQPTLDNVNVQLQSVKDRLTVIQKAETSAKNLDPLQQLVIVSQEDNAETRLGNLIAQQETLQQQLAFAKEVESAKVVVPARSVKASAHSRNTRCSSVR